VTDSCEFVMARKRREFRNFGYGDDTAAAATTTTN